MSECPFGIETKVTDLGLIDMVIIALVRTSDYHDDEVFAVVRAVIVHRRL